MGQKTWPGTEERRRKGSSSEIFDGLEQYLAYPMRSQERMLKMGKEGMMQMGIWHACNSQGGHLKKKYPWSCKKLDAVTYYGVEDL